MALVMFLLTANFGTGQEVPPPNTQKLDLPFTPPDQALAALQMPSGFKATLFAHEPDVIQPIAVTSDSRGRLWVVECLTYSDGRENYDLKLKDRVIILEDIDQDGVFDKRTVFWDQGQKLTGIELGFGGIWLASAPNLLFIPDTDGDDRPDGPPEVLLDGFNGDEIRHNIVNGLRWGPDGWLYGRHGIQATSHVGRPGAAPSQRIAINCCIWRYHPQQNEFQVVAEGGTNPWGFDFDDHGEMFMINTVIGHMFHIVPGARYRRMYGAHFNPHTYQVIEQTADHYHWDRSEEHWAVTKKEGMSSGTDAAGGGHAHTGLMCYLGDNWPTQYRNQWFTANFHGRRINVDRTERDGCSYTARHEPDIIKSTDPWFRGIEMLYGPDGGVYLLDWSDIGECHENDGIHRTSGRIFKITYGDAKPRKGLDLSNWSDSELVQVNFRDNQWYVRHARRILQERVASGADMTMVRTLLKQLIASEVAKAKEKAFDSRPLLRALWALHSAGGADANYLNRFLACPDEHVRAWAVRLLAEEDVLSSATKEAFNKMAANDPSGLVRLYITSALHRLDLGSNLQIYQALNQHEADQADRNFPHLLWYRIEPQVMPNLDAALSLVLNSRIPIIRENISRRIASEMDSQPKAAASLVRMLTSDRPDCVANIARGMKLALQGRSRVAKPTGWDETFSLLTSSIRSNHDSKLPNSVLSDLKKLNVIFGDGQAIAELRKIANDGRASAVARRQAILEYASTKPDQLFAFLKPLITNKSLSNSVIKAMVYADDKEAGQLILNRFGHLDPEGKGIALDTLTSRKAWAAKLLQAVDSGRIPKKSLTAQHARQIADFEDRELSKQLAEVWGQVRKSDQARLQEMSRVAELCSDTSKMTPSESLASYQIGKKLFAEKCANCHVLYGAGSNVGPDLTGGDRRNMSYLLENIIDPNASIADSYRASKFVLADGRFVTGVVLQKTRQLTRIQTATEIATIETKEIEDFSTTKKSLMPEGLLENMSDDEIRALFHYLASDRKE